MAFSDSLLRALGRIATDVLRQQVQQRTSGARRRTKSTPGPVEGSRGTVPEPVEGSRGTVPEPVEESRRPIPEPVEGSRRPIPEPVEGYPGDFAGRPVIEYAPHAGRLGDPGEVVWCWVPYEEDHAQGKDRPVLLIGRDGAWLLGLPLTSKDHDRDEAQERRAGREWMDIGAGPWDSKGRPSEVRLDRIIRVDPATVRRSGSALDRALFDQVSAAVLALR